MAETVRWQVGPPRCDAAPPEPSGATVGGEDRPLGVVSRRSAFGRELAEADTAVAPAHDPSQTLGRSASRQLGEDDLRLGRVVFCRSASERRRFGADITVPLAPDPSQKYSRSGCEQADWGARPDLRQPISSRLSTQRAKS